MNYFQLISRDDEMFELLISSRIGLWSEDNSFKFVVFTYAEYGLIGNGGLDKSVTAYTLEG